MLILVLPVSGGGFINQLAAMQHICESEWRPDIILASSGGNVAAYVVAAADWKWAGIERVASELNQDLFLKPWNDIGLLSSIIGYFKGQMYNKGLGVEHFMHYYFTPTTICKNEIWTGTYNKDQRKTRLFCNKKKEDCILEINTTENHITQSMDPFYANGDIPMISQACFASASIPTVVPPQIIEDEAYVDGCVSGASPLVSLQGTLLDKAKEGVPIHIVYVNSVNLDHTNRKPIKNMMDAWHQAASDLVKSQTVMDRMTGFTILKAQKGEIESKEYYFNQKTLHIINSIQKKYNYSLTEIYPSIDNEVSLEKFNGQEVIQSMYQSRDRLMCRLWYVK